MNQRADHPHQAAVHLMKALRCCKDCYDVSETDYAQLGQLQFEKDRLARQLSEMGNPEQDLDRMRGQVHDLQYLIQKVKEQNQIAFQTGMRQVDQMLGDRQFLRKQQSQGFHLEIVAERQRYRSLNSEIQKRMEHIRYLHRINEELVNRFCKY